jgi:hypothetical protein
VNVTDTDVGVHPCTGEPAQFTIVQSGVIHFVALADGTVHITGTLRGTLSIDLLPARGTPDATGTFTSWFGGNGLLNEDGSVSGKAQSAFTFNGRGTNADGSVHLQLPPEREHGVRSQRRPEARCVPREDALRVVAPVP